MGSCLETVPTYRFLPMPRFGPWSFPAPNVWGMSAAQFTVRAPATRLDRMDIKKPIAHVAQDELAQILAMGIFELLAEAAEVDERILIWIHA